MMFFFFSHGTSIARNERDGRNMSIESAASGFIQGRSSSIGKLKNLPLAFWGLQGASVYLGSTPYGSITF
jgi:hypothetical protein